MKKIILKWLHQESSFHHLNVRCELIQRKFLMLGSFLLAAMFCSLTGFTQSETNVSGRITDSDGEALPGVTVLLKDSQGVGTITDIDGNYRLTLPAGQLNGTLVFSYVGYLSEEVPIGNQTIINMSLVPDIMSLDELIVVGYGTMESKEVTSAVTHVDSEELLTVAGNNPLMSLQGKVAGLSIANGGNADPNSNPSIQLRGVSSRDAGLGPLIVLNGVPGGNLENVNQNDIESIDILKGGAASAIYGTRGSNGVIIITTKSGSGELQAEYNAYASFDFLANNQLEVLSADRFVEEGRGNDFGAKTDWMKEVTQSYAFSQKHTLSVSGGSENTTYRATVDYRDAEGIDLRSQREEYGARIALTHIAKNGLYEVGVNMAPRYNFRRNADYGVFSRALYLNPTMPVMDPENPAGYYPTTSGFDFGYNPVEQLNTELDGTEGKLLDWNGSFKLNLLDNLNTQVTVGQFTHDYFDFYFRPSTSTEAILNQSGENSARRKYNKWDQRSLEWIGNYFLEKDNHSFKLLGGYSYQYFQESGMEISNRDMPNDAFTYNNIGDGLYNQEEEGRLGMDSWKNSSKLISFFGRVNYSFMDKYLASASLRYEGSSKFGYDNKWGYFPAASVGWRISQEPFLEGVSWISDLKLRADYGVTGNQDFGNYLSLDTYTGYGYYKLNGEFFQVWGPNQNTNYDLRWEKAKNTNIGLDFSLFDHLLSGSINYYTRINEDLLGRYPVQLPPNLINETYANVGTMKNSGLEIQLTANVIDKSDFTYSISFAGATNENEFVSFSNDLYEGQPFIDVVGMPSPGTPGTAQRLEEGMRVGSFYMLKSAGLSDEGEMLVYNQDGDVILANKALLEDRQYVGNGLPKFTASVGNTVKFRNWDATVFVRGSFGYEIFNTQAFYTGTQATQTGTNVLESAFDGGKYSGLTTTGVLTDYFMERGDFVKIDNVTVGYTFKLSSKYARSLRVYAAGRNLATFTDFTGGDPDQFPVNGLYPGINSSRAYYPSTTQLMLGVNFGF